MFDPTVILLDPIVEVTIAAVNDLTAQGLADGTRVGIMPIGRHSLWGVTNHIDSLLEEALRCFHVSLFAEHGINQIAIAIAGPIELAPLSMDADIRFINVPGFPCLISLS